MKQPNILLILCDEMRGDCLGIAGHPDVKTPWLDTLARNGILYQNAYSACPSCVPARAAIHTGMRQENHGRVGYQDGVRWAYPHTMAGELTRAGYQTECVGKMHVHPLRNCLGYQHVRLHDGYLHYYRRPETPAYEQQKDADDYLFWLRQQRGPQADITDTGLDCNAWVARPWNDEERLHPTRWVTDQSLDFLRSRDRDRPFFLTVSYVRPHAPYDAPEAFFEMYRHRPLSPIPVGDWADPSTYLNEGREANSTTAPADDELLEQARIGYYACITQMDYEIGRLYMKLLEDHLLENTLILFASDHGDMLGDHHFVRKSLPYEGSCHVPMILSGPERLTGGRRGSVSGRLTELRDIMPTLLEAAGASIPDSVDGKSLLTEEPREYIHGEHTNGLLSNQFIVTGRDKFIWFTQTGREQYFDLLQDPKELHDRIEDGTCKERIAYLRDLLIRALEGRVEGFVESGHLVPGKQQTPTLPFITEQRL